MQSIDLKSRDRGKTYRLNSIAPVPKSENDFESGHSSIGLRYLTPVTKRGGTMHQTSNQCDQRNLQISSTITKAYPGLLLLGIVLACALLAEHVKALEATQSAPASDARRDMIKALEASGPHPSLGEQARVFDRLVGTWDCDYSFYRDDGTVRHSNGQLLVGWILDGLAVQDLFISYTAKASTSERTGAVEEPNSLQAFKQLTSLVGEWKGVQDKTEIKLKYTLIGNGSVLMEESRPGTEAPMFTMFTVDGDHLIATHYCSMGNQPQMMTKTIADPSGKSLTFSLSHVYGLKTPGDWHNTGLTLTFDDTQHLTQVVTYDY